MSVVLVHHTPLWVASKAIRKCWSSEDKSDTSNTDDNIGEKDRALIHRVGNKNKHASTLEHLNYNFDITMSRACLQEWARHRMASLSVKSTRYTLKELKDMAEFVDRGGHLYSDDNHAHCNEDGVLASKFLYLTGNGDVDRASTHALEALRVNLKKGIPNDIAKYCLPEAYLTSMSWTVNARSLQNFLALRTNKAALKEIRDLAHAVFEALPEEHKYLFEEFVNERV